METLEYQPSLPKQPELYTRFINDLQKKEYLNIDAQYMTPSNTNVLFMEHIQHQELHFFVEYNEIVPGLSYSSSVHRGWIPGFKLSALLKQKFIQSLLEKLQFLRYEKQTVALYKGPAETLTTKSLASVPPQDIKHPNEKYRKYQILQVDQTLMTEVLQDIQQRVKKEQISRNESLHAESTLKFSRRRVDRAIEAPSQKKSKLDDLSDILQVAVETETDKTNNLPKICDESTLPITGSLIERSISDTITNFSVPDVNILESDLDKAIFNTKEQLFLPYLPDDVPFLFELADQFVTFTDTTVPQDNPFQTIFCAQDETPELLNIERRLESWQHLKISLRPSMTFEEFNTLYGKFRREAFNYTFQDMMCGLCLHILSSPVTLPLCRHSFCLTCLHSFFQSDSLFLRPKKLAHCPLCQLDYRRLLPGEAIPLLSANEKENDDIVDMKLFDFLFQYDVVFRLQMIRKGGRLATLSGLSSEESQLYLAFIECIDEPDPVLKRKKISEIKQKEKRKDIIDVNNPVSPSITERISDSKLKRPTSNKQAPKKATANPKQIKSKNIDSSNFIKIPKIIKTSSKNVEKVEDAKAKAALVPNLDAIPFIEPAVSAGQKKTGPYARKSTGSK